MDDIELHMQFYERKLDYYVFEVFIKNNSNDTIAIDSSSLYYVSVSEKEKKAPRALYGIDPEKKIPQLESRRDSLLNLKNPYSMEGYTIKAIISEALIVGTLAYLRGLSADELALEREESKEDWEDEHNRQLEEVNNELGYWNESAFFPYIIPPNDEINRKVLFPIDLYEEELELRVLLKNDMHRFRFVQSRHYLNR